ncbi:MerR family transcriptional regulator [Streptomyces mangrovisoli]|nr:MerR family transcriptional regulator [Streptomyces mangrovisoli]
MRSIGEMARDSGLSVSALRFYDRAGVLVPAWVDPVSGYRWYGAEQVTEARLLARLRRAGMPLADIRLALAAWSGADADLVRGLFRAHLHRLEQDLSDARGEFSALRAQLDHREHPMTSIATTTPFRLSVPAPELAAALDSVRFAVATDPDLPMLGGILFDVEGDALRLVATDRYRMAVARARTSGYDGPRTQVVVDSPLADAMRALLTGDDDARFELDGDCVTLLSADRQAAGPSLASEFPDYRRLVELPAGRRAGVEVAAFRRTLRTGPVRTGETHGPDGRACELSVLRVTDANTVLVCDDGDDDPANVAVNRSYLLDALDAGGRDELVLELGAPTAPLAIRRVDDDSSFSVLMPVRLEN